MHYQSKFGQLDWVDCGQLLCVKRKLLFLIFQYGEICVEWAFNYFKNYFWELLFFLRSNVKVNKCFSVSSHLKCQFLSISSVVKLNLLPLNLKSALLGWTCRPHNFWFLLPRIFQLYLCCCISCSPWTGFSLATEEPDGIKNHNGAWLPNQYKVLCQSYSLLFLHLMYYPLWNIAPLPDLENLSSFTITLGGPP